MAEIEVKVRVSNPEEIVQALTFKGCILSDPIIQHDRIYKPKDIDKRDHVLRIRKAQNTIFFTLKKTREQALDELDNIEKELTIDDDQTMHEILLICGYELYVEVNKKRRTCEYKEFEVCIDEVENLGSFVEVEKISEDEGSAIQTEMMNFLKSLGVKDTDRVTQGYDNLMYQKLHQ